MADLEFGAAPCGAYEASKRLGGLEARFTVSSPQPSAVILRRYTSFLGFVDLGCSP
jgi:hypothetical protein